jgi:hypothetical protein
MRVGRPEWRRLTGVLTALGTLLVASACGSEPTGVATGADVDRPPAPSIDLVRFESVAEEVGLVFRHGAFQFGTDPDPAAMMGGGVCWIDYDRDGWLDLFATNTWSNGEWGEWREQGLPRSQLFRNDAGSFVDVTDDTGTGLETRANGCVAADLDLDGWTDLYVTTERENVLLWNDGGDGFVADADASGVDAFGWHSGAAVGDIDGNGWPDLFVAGYTDLNRPIAGASKGFPNTSEPEPDLLFLSDGRPESGDARIAFREVAAEVGIEPDGADYGLGSVLSDLDGDRDLDLYVANDTTPNQLYENVAADTAAGFRFVEIGGDAGVDDDGAGMGVASGDGNGDGRLDLVVTNQLEERHGAWWNVSAGDTLSFEDARAPMGFADLGAGSTGWGVVWADVDLDTDLDLFFAHGAIPVVDLAGDREPALLLENRTADGAAGEFVDASSTVGLGGVGPILARGAAAADYDNDGDIDLALGTIGGDLVLLRNVGAGGNWLLVATPTPSPGTRVTVTLEDGTEMAREVHAGSSYLSSEDPRAHFGVGSADRVASVVVDWPDGSSSRYVDVAVDQILQVEPGDGE